VTVDATGFQRPLFAEIRQGVRDDLVSSPEFVGLQTGPDTVAGQFVDVFASHLDEAYTKLQELYDVRPDSAEGTHLDDVCALVGVLREGASRSTLTLRFVCTGAGTLPAHTLCRIPDGALFRTVAEATAAGVGNLDVLGEALDVGITVAEVGEVSLLVDSPAFVASVTNTTAAVGGQQVESDTALRLRREQSLTARGAAALLAIRAELLDLRDVVQCVVRENTRDRTVALLPPHSGRCVLWPVTATTPVFDLLETIWPCGIRALGTQVRGDVAFDWATALQLYISALLTVDSDFPADGTTRAVAALTAYCATLQIGAKVWPLRLQAAITANVSGVTGCTILLKFGAEPGGSDTSALDVPWDSIAVLAHAGVAL
jgi:uncharacterized phage protein gp47/JayE